MEDEVTGRPLPWPSHVRCGTCRWWGAPYLSDRGAFRFCGRRASEDGEPDAEVSGTSEDFGCRLWEPRE